VESDLAMLVVLYHPTEAEIFRIVDYSSHLPVYVYDNTESGISATLKEGLIKTKNIYLDSNGINEGLSCAYNASCKRALCDGYKYLITLDQDSIFQIQALQTYISKILSSMHQDVGLYAPAVNYRHQNFESVIRSNKFDSEIEIQWAISSGSCLNLSAWNNVSGFDEKYFIDVLDRDYCARIRVSGYKIIQFTNVLLEQNLGQSTKKFGFTYATHSSVRHYYLFRNRLYFHLVKCRFEYGLLSYPIVIVKSFRHLMQILMLEDIPYKKILMCLRAFKDFCDSRMGQIV
jgi:rhamnosyltransferase